MTRVPAPPSRIAAAGVVARGLLLPLFAGAACVLGFAPFYAWPVPIAALLVLFLVWRASGSALQAALSGFAFGLGYFLAGVSWVYVSMHVYGGMNAVLAAIATFAFCAYLAIFPAAAGWLAFRLTPLGGRARMVAMPAAFVALEWLRGWLFTGFPWLTLGTSQAPSGPLAGYAPLVGAYGVSLALAAAAALMVAAIGAAPWSRARAFALAGVVLLLGGGGLLRFVAWTSPSGEPVRFALLQGNVPQDLKFRDEARAKTLADYREMAARAEARVVVFPETALPTFLDRLPPGYIDDLRARAVEQKKDLLIGALERGVVENRYVYYNSVVAIGRDATQSFRKRHLVPFGEYTLPGFHWALAVLRIPLADFERGAPGQTLLRAAGLPVAVTICYEDIFGEEVIAQLPEAQVLLNVSNTAWFGRSLASDQHLQASQLRSIETGRWSLRATNTGVTAAVDERGRVVSRLPQFTTGTLLADAVPHTGTTPYIYWGNLPVFLLLAGMLAGAGFAARRR